MTSAYSRSGVRSAAEMPAFGGLLDVLRGTFAHREAGRGKPALGFGHYANVLDVGSNLGIAISTDGVGTKILIAEMLGKYDTVGIDCVAMNANDIVCVGAEPIAMVDYVAVEASDGDLLRELAVGIAKGAELANIAIPGGEVAQVPDMVHGAGAPGSGFDLVGTCVGTVAMDRIITGARVEPGDAVVGFASSGIHSNGLTLARKALLGRGDWTLDTRMPELSRTLGEELLEPTAMYVRLALSLLAELDVRAMMHITGDGFLNLQRIDAPCGFRIEVLPEPPPIFGVIARAGEVPAAEMYRVYNMGVGFVAVVPEADTARAVELGEAAGFRAWRLGSCTDNAAREVELAPVGLRSAGERLVDA